MVTCACQGYCGGRVQLEDVRKTRDGERFCPECYDTYLEDR